MVGDYSNDITLECAFDTIYRETAAEGGTSTGFRACALLIRFIQ